MPAEMDVGFLSRQKKKTLLAESLALGMQQLQVLDSFAHCHLLGATSVKFRQVDDIDAMVTKRSREARILQPPRNPVLASRVKTSCLGVGLVRLLLSVEYLARMFHMEMTREHDVTGDLGEPVGPS